VGGRAPASLRALHSPERSRATDADAARVSRSRQDSWTERSMRRSVEHSRRRRGMVLDVDTTRPYPEGVAMSLLLPRWGLVAIGGLVGSVARYWLSGAVQDVTGHTFPSGTLAVNVVGSFVIGLVMALSVERGLLGDEWRILLTTGFCGGFTTMSTFSYETLALLRDGENLLALWNVTGSFVACVGAAWLGTTVGRLSGGGHDHEDHRRGPGAADLPRGIGQASRPRAVR